MKALYVYNPHSVLEQDMLDSVKGGLSLHVDKVEVMDLDEAKQKFHIRATPALIVIRDDLQGEYLLDEETGHLRIIGEVYKRLEDDDRNIYQKETHRVDKLIKSQVEEGQEILLNEIISRGVL